MKLSSMLDGALQEKFDRELRRVAENISDPNTSSVAKRQITIKMVIAPSDDRTLGAVGVTVESKLAPSVGAIGTLVIGYDHQTKQGKVTEYGVKQLSLEDIEPNADNPNVIDLRKKESAE